jgi:hypothetical protein
MTKTTSRAQTAADAMTLAKMKHLTESIVMELAYERNAEEFYYAIASSHPDAITYDDLTAVNELDFNEGYANFTVRVKGGYALIVTFVNGAYETMYKA